MSAWRIFSDDRNNFRWEITDQQIRKEEYNDVPEDTCRLPSMADLLLLGSSKLLENGKSNVENTPMFCTGLGKSVELKQSSIAKARSVVGAIDNAFTDAGHLDGRENESASLRPMFDMNSSKSAVMSKSGFRGTSENVVHMSNSMFQTGSGRSVNISSAGLLRAKTLLGLDENNDHEQTEKQPTSTELLAGRSPSFLKTMDSNNLGSTKILTSSRFKSDFEGSESTKFLNCMNDGPEPPPVKFQTAGGRSISVSGDALQRAKSLLGNPEFDSFLNEASKDDMLFSTTDDGKPFCSSNQKNDFTTPFSHKGIENGDMQCRNFTSPPISNSYKKQSFGLSARLHPGNNLITKFDTEAAISPNRSENGLAGDGKPPKINSYTVKADFLENAVQPKIDPSKTHTRGALMDISNTMNIDFIDDKQIVGEKRRFRRIISVSPFKKPRSSFVTPFNKNNSSDINVLSRLAPKETSCKQKVSSRYPLQFPRAYLEEYFLHPPLLPEKLETLPEYVKRMNPIAAESYTFQNEMLSDCIRPEGFYWMLSQSGASTQYLTKEWVSNHYKWIVWKLASYERCYPAKFTGKLLTVSNVLEELRYRYEREVNHGHISSIKKILDGDAPPSSMMVLCISSVIENHDVKCGNMEGGSGYDSTSKIELTDGWYSMKAQLDEMLSQKLASGKLFLGQKLKIWGAKLCGWLGPVSPFEASRTTSLSLHINGTYRCHWAERLGFCKRAGVPLAFRCIKRNGGVVPSTLVGVTRMYPVLYRQRLSDGSFTVRSERMEAKALQLYNQRRDAVAEGIILARQKETVFDVVYDHEGEEGAKLMKLLETSAEPEVLMAGMSSKELASFASYKAKLEAIKQSEMQKSVEEAVEAAGLGERDVTPFLRIKVVGLTNKSHSQKHCPQKGMITIWNPTKKQMLELCEGQAYAVGGLVPSSSDSGILYLQTRGSSSNWSPLSPLTMEKFESFFTPRSSATLSSLGEVPLSSEFDIAAFVVYVGEVYRHGHHQKQWVFVTDGSTSEFCSSKSPDVLMAINFSLPCIEFDSSPPVNSNITGSVVGFCNLTKRSRDQVNGLWVAEATENSDYFLSYDHVGCNHLKDAASSISKWAKTSSLILEKLKERVISIIRSSRDRC